MSASVHGTEKNKNVTLFESSNIAGGRCRSFFEKKLGIEIDNGNHLVFSANENFYELCKIIRSTDKIVTLPPKLDFYDLDKNLTWCLDLKEIKILKFLLGQINLIPDTNFFDYTSLLKFLFVSQRKTVTELVGNSKIYKTFWEPLTLGIMNTASSLASAKVLSNVLKKTIFKGQKFCNIYQPAKNWNDTVINPCISFLKRKGTKINFRQRLKSLEIENNNVKKLYFENQNFVLDKNDKLVLAIPPSNLSRLFPSLKLPAKYNIILNIHYKTPREFKKMFTKKIIGFINSLSHWIFIKKEYLSVTVSNANYLNNLESDKIAEIVWKEICSYLNINFPITKYQVVKEKKATIIQSPDNFKLIKQINNLPENLRISGDWTQTNLPCTIEGSILSGKKAVKT